MGCGTTAWHHRWGLYSSYPSVRSGPGVGGELNRVGLVAGVVSRECGGGSACAASASRIAGSRSGWCAPAFHVTVSALPSMRSRRSTCCAAWSTTSVRYRSYWVTEMLASLTSSALTSVTDFPCSGALSGSRNSVNSESTAVAGTHRPPSCAAGSVAAAPAACRPRRLPRGDAARRCRRRVHAIGAGRGRGTAARASTTCKLAPRE